ncbi:hypothetical protein J6590_063503 [Homalodisca vitripennis]|nr:hypothetical protein J6590_063503 [Homalodisca vitripennis]
MVMAMFANEVGLGDVILNSSSTLERDNVYSLFKTFLGNSLLSAPVHTWKRYRKLINPVLHPSNVEHFLPVFNEVGRKLTEQLSVSSPPSDRTDDMFDMALDASLRTVISRIPISDETKTDIKYVLDSIGRIFILRVFKVWLHVDWLFNLIYWKELKQAHKIMGKFMNTINQVC